MKLFVRCLPVWCLVSGAIPAPAQFGVAPMSTFGSGGWLAPNGYHGSTYTYLTTNDTERGLACANGHLYLVSRNGGDSVRILDARTGQDLGALNLGSNTVSGGTFNVNMAAAGGDGAIYVGNLATGPAPFRIYRWANDGSNTLPTVVYSGVPLAGARVGDSLAVIGGGGSTLLAAGFNNSPSVAGDNGYAILDPNAGTATTVGFGGTAPAAGDFRLAISFVDSSHVVGTPGGSGSALRYTLFSGSNGTLVASPGLASTDERALSVAVVGGFTLLAAVSTADSHVSLYNLADPANPVLVGQANATTGTLPADSHNTAAVAWGSLNGNKANLYAMATDMGIQAFVVSVPAPSAAAITNQPGSQTVEELYPATFSVGATGIPIPSYQWYRGASLIPAATNASYTIPRAALGDNGAEFEVVVQNVIGNVTYAVTSGMATLTVMADTNPPVLLGAQALGLNQVLAAFSEWIDPGTGTNPANYSIEGTNGALTISSAALDASQTNIVLGVSPMVEGAGYTLTVNHVKDQSAAGNVIAADSQAEFTGIAYALTPIGSPALAGSQAAVAGGYDISAGGAGITGDADEGNLSYQLQSGDFDFAVRIDSIGLADAWSEAGLMAREDLSAGARSASVLGTPSISGAFFASRAMTNGPVTTAGSFPVNYPDTWLRLKRAGNVFSGYAGFDGQNWAQLGSVNLTLAPTLYFGFVVSSHNTNQVASAGFRDFGPVGGAGTNLPPAIETLAQCTRRTSLAISEIMYHPGNTRGTMNTNGLGYVTNSLEYIELFNSRGEMQDLSGYQLAGSISFTFPAGTVIPGGGFLVVAKSPADIESVYGLSGVLGLYTNSLPNSTGTVRLLNQAGGVFLEINYGTTPPWPVSPDGGGHSLVLARPSYGEDNPLAWAASDSVGGSPGRLDPVVSDPLRDVVINEFLAHPDPPLLGFIELFNRGLQTLDISGCSLSNDPTTNRFLLPPGTTLGPRAYLSFDQNQLGFTLEPSGGTLYFRNALGTRVLDVVRYEAQLKGVSSGRAPDGGPAVRPLAARTPGAANSGVWQGPIVINEIMYDPISLNDDDQYVELYNRGAQAVEMAGWQFVSGIGYAFQAGTAIPPGGYLVVGRNAARMSANYSNLNAINLVGNFSGTLSHKGERLALAMPDLEVSADGKGGFTTNTIYPIENELTYNTGGRWGEWSHGGGSSLELIDPRADNSLAPNWADSDETRKAGWTMLSATGTIDNGNVAADELQVLVQGVGECLVDDVQVLGPGGTNLVPNSTLESGAAGWTAEGTEQTSSLETTEGHNSSRSYHVRAVEKGDNQVNRVRVPLSSALAAGTTNVTIRGAVRWLKGDPEVLFRLRGNWLECAGELTVPGNLGTPGAPNSRYVSNAPPAISEVQHSPVLPGANQSMVVTARVSDPDGVTAVILKYRLDPSSAYSAIPMTDDGTGADLAAGDGIYTATIPGQAAGTMIAFYIQATDGFATPATDTFPNDAPVRECLIRVGEFQPTGNFPVYRLWMTQATMNTWNSTERLNNTSYDITFVLGNQRVIYNAQARFKGSPYISPGYCGAACGRCGYTMSFPPDDLFLGDVEVVLDWPGGHGGETTALQEQMCYWIADHLNLPFSHRYTIRLHINGITDVSRQATFEAVVQPDASFVKEWNPNDSGGELFKIERAFEFTDTDSLVADPEPRLQLYTTTGGVKKRERYRWNWMFRSTDLRDDYTNIFALVDAVNAAAPEPYTSATMGLVDIEEWMGAFATEHIIENFDAYGHEIGKNMYAYQPVNGKWQLYLFDLDWAMLAAPIYNSIYAASSGPLFNADDPTITRMYAFPPFVRAYWRAVQNAVNGPFDPANCNPVIDAKSRSLFANGILWCDGQPLTDASGVKTWFSQRRTFLQAQLASVAAPFLINSVVVSNNLASISGRAPIGIKTISFNGTDWPVIWTTVNSWTASVPLQPGTNLLNVVGVDTQGRPVPGASNSVAAVYSGPASSPVGQVVINEIMYNPQASDPGYVELYNTSSHLAFDLSGWEFSGLDYTFPAGSLVPANGYLVLTPNRGSFAAAYGATNPVFDTLSVALPTEAGTLALLQPDSNGIPDQMVSEVRYSAVAPWPAGANGTGASLQLIDPSQDNWRVGNWAVGSATAGGSGPRPATPSAQNSVAAALPPFQPLWINEIEAENISGITNSAGQRGPWIELYNPTTNAVPLAGLYLANNYTNLAGWACPAAAVMNPGEFKVIFADGQTNLSTTIELHVGFILPGGAGSVALSRLYNGQPQVLDYLDYTNLTPDHSFGSLPDGQAFVRQEFFTPTPGGTNAGNPVASFIAYSVPGSVYTQDFNSLPDPGPVSVNTANPVTINGITYLLPNPFDFASAASATSPGGGLGLPALAGWFGLADPTASVGVRFGATDGDQTTGGVLSFGLPGSTNRALGLLATTTTGFTAFGARFLNATPIALDHIRVQFTGQVWRQSDKAKALTFHYLIDPSGLQAMSTQATAYLPSLNVSFPTVAADVGGVAVDGSAAANQTSLGLADQPIAGWTPGAALWLVWEMTDPAGKAQGLAIDDLSFSAWNGTPRIGPSLAAIPNQVVTVGQVVELTALATDTDQPPPALTFSLGTGAPSGAVVDPSTGQFTWIPANGPSTNLVSIVVSDNGVPSLSATQSFTVTVLLPAPPPRLTGLSVSAGAVAFSWASVLGRVYRVQYSDDLRTGNWSALGADQTGTGAPLSLTLAISNAPQRFYRVQVR